MDIKEAIGIVERHNKWRRGEIEEYQESPKIIGLAIDLVINYVKREFLRETLEEMKSMQCDNYMPINTDNSFKCIFCGKTKEEHK